MRIRLNKAHFPVTALGPGRRVGIWVQGCNIGCPGCISQDTWDPDSTKEMPVGTLLEWCREITHGDLDGVTISGGEPFQQIEALQALLGGLLRWREDVKSPFDILCYSGLPYKTLASRYSSILAKLDAVIPEPYVAQLPRENLWSGSANQPLIPLSPLGREKYNPYLTGGAVWPKRFQFAMSRDRIWYIGIPEREDMARLERACQERGLRLRTVSWRA